MDLSLSRPRPSGQGGVDADTAERILVPLIENGCRYGRSRVEVSVRPNGDAVEFRVEDDGPGFTAGESERIFEPGFRGARPAATTTTGQGSAWRSPAGWPGRSAATSRRSGTGGAAFRARLPSARPQT